MNINPSRFARPLSRLAAAASVLLSLAGPVRAVIDDYATEQIWKLKFGVTDAQLYTGGLPNSTWRNADDDGDGLKNDLEMAAGTNPFSATKTIKVSSIVKNGAVVDLQFPTESGKLYRVESTTTLSNANSWVLQPQPTPVQVIGDGGTKTLSVAYAANTYYRVRVSDIDGDGDGVGNWAEMAVSLDPAVAQTINGVSTLTYVTQQIALPNVVTIKAATPFASEDGPTAGKLTVTRTQNLFPITVNYGIGGTAVPNTDYSALTGSVVFAARGTTSEDIFVNPMVTPAVKGSRSVTAALAAPGAVQFPFTLGAPNNATVIINDSMVAAGTGLTGRYYDTFSGTQADAGNFGQAGMYAFTRGTPTTTGTIVVTYTGATIPGLVAVPSGIGASQVKVSFTSGSLSNSLYNNFNYPVIALTANSFTLSITAAAAFGFTTTNGNCNFSIQSFTHPATVTRVEPTINFDWQYGTPNGNVIAPNNSADNYSATWEGYLNPTTAGSYIFQLDADDKARVLVDLNNNGTFDLPGEEIVEHGWDTSGTVSPEDGVADNETIGTFKQSAPVTLAVPGTPAQRYKMRVEQVETTGDARCRLQWSLNGGGFANIPQANQFTHTQALAYSYTAATGSAVITPTGGHAFAVNDSVTLAFSSGALFTPGAASTHNKAYTITAVNGTTTYTVAITGFSVPITGATTAVGSPNILVPSTTGLAVGMAVSGTGLPASEFITAIIPSANGPGLISVTTGTGVTTQANTNLTAVLPSTGTPTGSGFVLNVPTPPNTPSPQTGLYNLCYGNTGFTGSPGRVGIDGAVTAGNNGLWNSGTPEGNLIQPDTFSARWTGQVQPQYSETYTFVVQADDGCALSINGQPQVLSMSPSALTGGPTYLYDSVTGNAMINYSGLAVPSGTYALGETARPDFANGNLNNNPTNSCTYTYDATAGTTGTPGALVVDYTNVTIGQPGGTRVAASYAIEDTVEVDPTSGSVSNLGNLPYTITAASGNTFTVQVGTLNFDPTIGISSISAASPCEITTVKNHGFTVGTQVPVRIASVSGGTFSQAINGLYTVTITGPKTFTAGTNCSLAPTPGTGIITASGNVAINDSRNLVISKLYASGSTYTYTSGTGVTTINYSALNLPANTFTAGSSVELAGTSNALASVKSASYTIVAPVTTNSFTVTFPTLIAGTNTGNINIAAPVGGPIPASGTNAFTVNVGANKYADLSSGSVNLDIVNKTLKDWSSNGNERYCRMPMIGGVRYDIQLDSYENNSQARCFLSWFSPSQPKQIIPQERLYPASVTQAPPSHIAATSATALANGPFSYQVAGNNGATVTISGNPAWLTYSNGVLSGTPPPGAAGDYQIIITLSNAAGTSTSVLNLHVGENTGSVAREYWTGVAGTTVASIPTGTTPAGTDNLITLEGPTNFGDNYGARIRGYITAPTTGNYYFWIAANNAAELWISNDAEPVEAQKRAWVTTGNATPRTWNDSLTQKSPLLALEAGQRYYFEVLHKAGVGADNLAVGWLKPGETGTVPSQVVPGYVLSPFTVLVPLDPGSTIYSAILRPQTGVVTNASGNSFIRLKAGETEATVSVNYSGLTSGYFGMHVHDDLIPGGGLANVIADFDQPLDVTKQADGSYHWVIQPRSGYSVAQLVDHLKTGHLYFNVHSTNFPNGEIKGYYSRVDGSQTFTAPAAPLGWTDDSNTSDGASRFLSQATFGANPAEIAALKALSPAGATNTRYEHWINDQFGIAQTEHLPEVKKREIADVFGPFDVRVSFDTWWKTSMTAQDQLRQRVAFALSQIHVVSGQGPLEDNSLAISDFYDTLAANAFGNFRDVLIGTTLTPAMGRYLDMLRNDKPDQSVGRSPNENYAREIKQLFSIGLYRMWPDGTLILNSQYEPVDTYTQREIVGLAHVFTGWDYGYDGDLHTSLSAAADWTRPMREVPARHFTGPKRVLNNEVLPGLTTAGGQPLDPYATHGSAQYYDPAYAALPAQELNAVHDMLFNHSNTGPFVCRQLIQRLVTSNPSKEYLYRVVQKFNDNGSGTRGDMQAVIKAILLDYEARSSTLLTNPSFGKQREPIQRVTDVGRAFRPADVSGGYSQTGALNTSGVPYILITTSTPHLLSAANNVFLEFTDTTGDPAKPAPTTGTYTVLSNPAPTSTTYAIAAPGWLTGTYTWNSNSTVTINMSGGHYLPGDNVNVLGPTGNPAPQVLPAANKGQAYFEFTSGLLDNSSIDHSTQTVLTSTSYDIPSGVGNSATAPALNGNTAGTTYTIAGPSGGAGQTGNVMIPRFGGGYQSTGRNGIITIDTTISTNGATNAGNYGAMADHALSIGDSVFLNFTNSRDTTSGVETSTENDLLYTIASVPDLNTFTVQARDAANAAMNSDNQVFIFPLKTQPMARSGTVNARPSTFNMDNTDTDLQQTPLNSPTVFNFFLPDYKFAGPLATQGVTTPEFQLTSETTVIRQANFMYAGVFGSTTGTTGFSSFKTGSNALVLDLTPWMGNAVNTVGSVGYILGNGVLGSGQQIAQVWTSNANLPILIDRLTTLLLPGQLPASAKATIQAFIGGQISSVTTGSPCTINVGAAHNYAVGDSVTITGITGGTWSGASASGNGTFFVTAVPTTTSLRLATATTGGTNLNCTSTTTNGGLSLTNSTVGIISYTNASPTATNISDRLRALVHLILTSPDFTIQR